MPKHHVLILNRILPRHPLLDALAFLALVRKLTGSVKLSVLILCHPDRLRREPGALGAVRSRTGQEHLRRRGLQLIRDGLVRDRVNVRVISDLEHAVTIHARVGCSAGLQNCLLRRVAHVVWVVVVLCHRHAIFVVDSVLEAIDGGIHAEREHVLMVGRHDAGSDVRAPWNGGAEGLVIKGHGGQDTSGADLQLDIGCLVEDEREDVFVVGDGADHLYDELAVPDDCCGAGAVVRVFMLEAVVLLVETDNVLQEYRVSFGVGAVAVEVLDMAETVAAEGQLIGRDAEANVADVKCLFAVVGCSRIYNC